MLLYQLWKLLFVIDKIFINLSSFGLSSRSPARAGGDADGARLGARSRPAGSGGPVYRRGRTRGTGPGRSGPPCPSTPAPAPSVAPAVSRPPSTRRPLPSAKMAARAAPSPAGSAGPQTRWGPARRPLTRSARQQGRARSGPGATCTGSAEPRRPAQPRLAEAAVAMAISPAANRAPLPLTSAPTRGSKMAASAAMVSAAAPRGRWGPARLRCGPASRPPLPRSSAGPGRRRGPGPTPARRAARGLRFGPAPRWEGRAAGAAAPPAPARPFAPSPRAAPAPGRGGLPGSA